MTTTHNIPPFSQDPTIRYAGRVIVEHASPDKLADIMGLLQRIAKGEGPSPSSIIDASAVSYVEETSKAIRQAMYAALKKKEFVGFEKTALEEAAASALSTAILRLHQYQEPLGTHFAQDLKADLDSNLRILEEMQRPPKT